MSFTHIRKISIAPDSPGHYYSFPTATVNESGIVLVSYRDGSIDGGSLPAGYNGHGEDGDMYILGWSPDGEKIIFNQKIYDHRVTGENEQNAIISSTEGSNIFLFSRQHGSSDRVYFSYSEDDGRTFFPRREVLLGEFEFLACYGKIREVENFLVAPVYGVRSDYDPLNRRCGAAWIYSEKKPFQWKFGGWISHPLKGGPSFNETAIFASEGKALAVLRSGEGGEMLYVSVSTDALKSWSAPAPAGFRGEAPELHDLGQGRVALSYRGFPGDGGFCWAMRVSKNMGKSWGEPLILDKYSGSRFHGGYGDIVLLGKNRWLGVVYSPGKSGLPGLNGVVFRY